jgi:hypothetical protein
MDQTSCLIHPIHVIHPNNNIGFIGRLLIWVIETTYNFRPLWIISKGEKKSGGANTLQIAMLS